MSKVSMDMVQDIINMENDFPTISLDSVTEFTRNTVSRKEIRVNRKHEDKEEAGNNRHSKVHRKW